MESDVLARAHLRRLADRLRASFAEDPFTLDQAKRALGSFVPRGTVHELRRAGHIRLRDDGRMEMEADTAGSRVPLEALDVETVLARTAEAIKASTDKLSGVRRALRQVDGTGLERVREQRRARVQERDAHALHADVEADDAPAYEADSIEA